MSLFRTSFPAGTGDFAPLFRLLDDYDVHRNSRNQATLSSFAPRFDVRETDSSYQLDGELPGAIQKNVDIEFSDAQTLVIKGHSEREYQSPEPKEGEKTEGEGHKYWVSERTTGEFQRVFTFPTPVDHDKVKATLKNGILSVTVPKTTAPTTKKITIE